MKKIILLIFCFSMFGCAGSQMYYFGNYSETLYQYEKEQTEKSLSKHKKELQRIIEKSKSLNKPVPPGIYAELGYLNLKDNKKDEAVKFFHSEADIYPESKQLMDRLILITQKEQEQEEKIN